MLHIAELRFSDSGGDTLIVHSDGRIEAGGQVVGSVQPDGTLVGPDATVALTLNEDGSIVDADGRALPVTVDAEGTLRSDTGQELRFTDDGSIVGENTQAPTVTVQGITPETRRTAMFVLAGLLLPVRAPSEAEGSVPAEVAPEVDCSRVDDPGYQAEMEAAGVDLETVDCEECDGCEE
jgi:hypothetical protein